MTHATAQLYDFIALIAKAGSREVSNDICLNRPESTWRNVLTYELYIYIYIYIYYVRDIFSNIYFFLQMMSF